jgi:ABC-2 type transport system ATP-binding protein
MLTTNGHLYGMHGAPLRRRVDEVIESVQLCHTRHAALRSLSKGTLQRADIAQAILNHPERLILDEPKAGLDPTGRHFIRELIRSLHSTGATAIFCSQILSDAEVRSDRVTVLTMLHRARSGVGPMAPWYTPCTFKKACAAPSETRIRLSVGPRQHRSKEPDIRKSKEEDMERAHAPPC